LRELRAKGAKYCLSVHAMSNLRMKATLSQSGFEPGATLYLRAVLTEYGQPVDRRARVVAEVQHPDHSLSLVAMAEGAAGVFSAALPAAQSGIYRVRMLAEGATFRAQAFTREEIFTAAVWPGGNRPTEPPKDADPGHELCGVLRCLLSEKVLSRELEERLRKAGIELDALRHCVNGVCRQH